MLLCLSANHRNAGLDVLEALSVGAPQATRTLVDDVAFVSGAVVLATCNRFEAYLDIDEPLTGGAAVASESVVDAMAAASGLTPDELRTSVHVHEGDRVISHLFSVTSGLESMAVGEDEISGQVRRALDDARTEGTSSSDLERLFQKALHTSRGVRNRTSLRGAHRSLVRLALDLASSRITDWSKARVLVVGTGRYAARTVGAVRALGADDLRVYSPSGRAAAFASTHGLVAEPSFADAAHQADVVITCTTDAVVHADAFAPGHRVLVIDLGLPRNVDAEVGAVDGVELLDLETIKLHEPLAEFDAHAHARALVGDAASEYAADIAAGPAITALRREVHALLDAEIARARARGAGDETEAALRHLAGVLLHGPSVRIRDLALQGRIAEVEQAMRTLHDIAVPPAVTPAVTRPDEREQSA
ncbi:glutamyl-tRNA reductase [Microbacterium sp. bgisy189]|uniref:glutamyl-tRNA reductase n=1 Tax=Microbacterium sp. bgisy189 TaxID=3413798 RepID=UPI003EC0D1CA